MAKKSRLKKRKGKKETGDKEQKEQAVVTGGINMQERRNLVFMSVLTLLLVFVVAWRLEPTLETRLSRRSRYRTDMPSRG